MLICKKIVPKVTIFGYDILEETFNTKYIQLSDAKLYNKSHPAKIDLNKKRLPKQKTIQNVNIDAQEFRKIRNENPPTREIGVTS